MKRKREGERERERNQYAHRCGPASQIDSVFGFHAPRTKVPRGTARRSDASLSSARRTPETNLEGPIIGIRSQVLVTIPTFFKILFHHVWVLGLSWTDFLTGDQKIRSLGVYTSESTQYTRMPTIMDSQF